MYEGEQYAGIVRIDYPRWEGWRIIDRYKIIYQDRPEVIKFALTTDALLREYVEDFYDETGNPRT